MTKIDDSIEQHKNLQNTVEIENSIVVSFCKALIVNAKTNSPDWNDINLKAQHEIIGKTITHLAEIE